MKNLNGQRGSLLAIVGLLLCWSGNYVFADGELTTTSSTGASEADLGTGNYSKLPFKVEFNVRGGYDDNYTTTNNAQESPFLNTSVALTYDFGSPRTTLSLQAGVGYTYYFERAQGVGFGADQDYDINIYAGIALEHKASERLTFNVTTYLAFQTEPDFQYALGLNRRNGNYFFTSDKFGVTYMWSPRFATTTSYSLSAVAYQEDAIGLFEDHFENTFGNEFKFLIQPTTSLVLEYRFGLVNYTHEGDVIGPAPTFFGIPIGPAPVLERDSVSHYILAGFDHSFSPRFNVSFRGGVQFRDYVDSTQQGFDANQASPYFEGTVSYAVGKTTSVSWTNRYAIEEGDVVFNPSRQTFRTGLSARHDFTTKIGATLGVYYEHDDYDSTSFSSTTVNTPGFEENAFDLAISARYAITRYIGIEAGYNHTEVWSDVSLREYSRNRYWGGLNIVF